MKKTIFITLFCLGTSKLFAQESSESLSEEKGSEWVKVTIQAPPVARTTSRPRTTAAKKPAAPPPQTQAQPSSVETFSKTNNQVKRFKKGKNQ